MDVVLLTASAALTAGLSRHAVGRELSPRQRKSVAIAVGLSLCLFSLSILEATPATWLVFLDHDTTDTLVNLDGYLSITGVYRWILWILCLWIIIVLPAMAGGLLMVNLFTRVDRDDEKYNFGYSWWNTSRFRWLRYISRVFIAIPVILCRLSWSICWRIGRKYMGIKESRPLLPTSTETSSPSSRLPKSPLAAWFKKPRYMYRTLLGSVLGVLSCIVLLSSMAKLVLRASSESETTHLLPTMVGWLTAVGLLLSSALNGFGSVSLPYSCLMGLYLKPISPKAIAIAEGECDKTRAQLEAARSELGNSNRNSSNSSAPLSGRRRSVTSKDVSKKTFGDYGEDASLRRQTLQGQVEFLEILVSELEEDALEMKHSQVRAAAARTPLGKARSWMGVVFSVVLLIRLCTATLSILNGIRSDWKIASSSSSRTDPITTGLLWLMGHHLVSEQDYNALSQCISLLLTAFLSASQVRMFLRTASAIQRRLLRFFRNCYCAGKSNNSHFSPSNSPTEGYAHLLSATVGCYFLSCVVLTKMNLPLAYRSGFSAALGGTSFVVQSSVANAVYATSAMVSATVLGLLFGIQRQNTTRHVIASNEGASMGNFDAC